MCSAIPDAQDRPTSLEEVAPPLRWVFQTLLVDAAARAVDLADAG